MKKFIWYCILLMLAAPQLVHAQVAINTDASLPNASAMLEIKTNNKGFLGPRLTTVQRTGIASPADGLWVYDTDTKTFWYYKGSAWVEFVIGGSVLALPYTATINSTNTLLNLTNNSTGGVYSGITGGTGGFGVYGATANLSSAGVVGDNTGGGEAVVGRATSKTTPTGAVVGRNDGPGYGVYGFAATNTAGTAIGVLGRVGISSSTGYAGYFENLNSANAVNTLQAVSNGPGVIADHSKGNAGNFFMNNTNGVGAGVRGEVNSIFGNNGTAGVYGISSGTGGYGGYFEHSNTTGFGNALFSTNAGQGIGVAFQNTNAANTQAALQVNTNGTGNAVQVYNTSTTTLANTVDVTSAGPGDIPDHRLGNAGNFFANNNYGVGAGVRGEVNSIFGNNGTAGVYGSSSGTGGYGGYFDHTNATGYGYALMATNAGLGISTYIESTNASNASNVLSVVGNGPGVIANHNAGNAGNFFMNNTNGVGAGVRGEVNSIFGNNGTAGVYGIASGTGGYGGYFEHSSATGFGNVLYATNAGLGRGSVFLNTNATNAQEAVAVTTNGTGNAMTVTNTNTNSLANTLYVTSTGPGDIPDHRLGNAGNFFANNQYGVGAGVRGEVNSIFGNNGTAGVYGSSSGTGGYGGYFDHTNATGYGYALMATTAGQGIAAYIENTNSSNTSNTLSVVSNGPGVIANHNSGNAGNFFMNNQYGVGAGVRGEVNSIFGNNGTAGVYGVSSGTGGYAGYFEHTDKTGYGVTLQAVSYDLGYAMVVDKEGTSGDIAVFQRTGLNVARIDRNGKGFFNGGTQNSGADLAEAFDVTGSTAAYEPGDVLAISVDADRTVQKSQEAYSTLVVGVYATKPGVLLTEENVDSKLDDKVPMGVVGVIPTKVCNENGIIHRGDILVTASRPGYAMKADLNKLKPGQAIGKALQEFEGETGKIKVLVNVR
ncbi:MAG: hypothetical protein QM726_10315 [Chitinophagaceae bacterium]